MFPGQGQEEVKPIPICWVDINKGSLSLVQHTAHVWWWLKFRSTIDPHDKAVVFASTPPLEGVQVLCSLAWGLEAPVSQ